MGSIPGTVVGAKIVPTDTADVYGTHDALYGAGGWRSVDSTVLRDAIPSLQRQEGMVVFCTDSNAMYQLVDGITNSDWALLSTGVSGSGVAGNLTSWASSTDLSSAPAYVSSNQVYVTGPLHVRAGGTGITKTTEIIGNATGYTAFSGTTLAVINKGDAEMALYADTTKNCNILFCDNYSGSVPAYMSWSNTNNLLTMQTPHTTFAGDGTFVKSVLDADPSPDALILRRNVTDSPTDADKGPALAFSGPAAYGDGVFARIKSMAYSSSVCRIVVNVNAGPTNVNKDIAQFLYTTGGTRNPDATACLELLPGATIQSEGYHWQDIWAQCSFTGFASPVGTVRAYKLGRTAVVQFDVAGTGNTSTTTAALVLPAAYASGADSTAYGLAHMLSNGTHAVGDIIQFPSSSTLQMSPSVTTGFAGWSPYGARSMQGEFVIQCGMS